MHPNATLIQRLFSSLNEHDHEGMAACYHLQAKFKDIAFDLNGKKEIHAMWHMICQPDAHTSDICVMFNVVHADDRRGWVNLVDDYTSIFENRKAPIASRTAARPPRTAKSVATPNTKPLVSTPRRPSTP